MSEDNNYWMNRRNTSYSDTRRSFQDEMKIHYLESEIDRLRRRLKYAEERLEKLESK